MFSLFSPKIILSSLAAALILSAGLAAQSSDQNFPTAVTDPEIGSTIRARDIGDARLTTHFWVFDGAQGDIFINVVTQNFSGDIDVYQASDLKPLTKIVMFADSGLSETGRVIYLRLPGRLLLRVQGRSPNDDPASYKIKFAGSFVALAPQKEEKAPTVETVENTGVKVNSVGTRVTVAPAPLPVKEASTTNLKKIEKAAVPENSPAKRAENKDRQDLPPTGTAGSEATDVKTVFGSGSANVNVTKTRQATSKPTSGKSQTASARSRPETAPDPLAGVSLVIVLKDDTRIERPMSEITRFMYDHGFLTIFAKDGKVHRIAVTDLASVTVQ